MYKPKTRYFNKYTGQVREVGEGFSWGAFLLGFIWYFDKGFWSKGVLYLLLTLVLAPSIILPILLWLYMGFKFNEQYESFLIKEGFTKEPVKKAETDENLENKDTKGNERNGE